MPKRSQIAPFRKADLDNLPLQEARHRFIEQLAKHRPLRQELFGWPLRRWTALSDAARQECQYGWAAIQFCDTYRDLLPETLAREPRLLEDQRLHLEMIPLRDSLKALARKFELMYNGEPTSWAMDTLLENLHQRARRPKAKGSRDWSRPIEMSQTYPALTEPGMWLGVNGLPEEELFAIVIEILPKQPREKLKAFEKRFNDACRKKRKEYLAQLAAQEWTTRRKFEASKWIDRLAQWQAGSRQSEIDPSIKTPTDRTKFSRGIRAAADYIGITPRPSQHSSRHKGSWEKDTTAPKKEI